MRTFIEPCSEAICEGPLWDAYFGGMNIGVLDIETTGLNPQWSEYILGCVYKYGEGRLYQFLAENRTQEFETLEAFISEIAEPDVVITYNGKYFDIPFLEQRLRHHGMPAMKEIYNLDLYRVISGHSPLRSLLPNLKQKTVENYMGLWSSREDEISGAESADLYKHYEATADKEAERKILLHNKDDVRQLAGLTKVISKCDFHRAMFRMGFPVYESGIRLVTGRPNLGRSVLKIKGRQLFTPGRLPVDYVGFDWNGRDIRSVFNGMEESFEFEIPIIRNSGLVVIDLKMLRLEPDETMGAGSAWDIDLFPGCDNGFLVIAERDEIKYAEINYFTKALAGKFIREELK
ncbi:MAG: ribonuclease H-like domain-containing protein [Lentihominibacter sp.]|jgi:DNA polymerase III epsilon subunit-like protein